MPSGFCPKDLSTAARSTKLTDERLGIVCKLCTDPKCRAHEERICKGRFSYECAARQLSQLNQRIAALEADPGRLTRCRDCSCEIMVSAVFCQRCSGVEATDA